MPTKVFISYRRDDSAGHAGRLHDRLERELGRDLLFMDVDAIPLGVNFVKVVGEEVAKCDVLLAIIGPNWLDARDESGNRRIESSTDFVRIEIATALNRDIPVIPILLEGTRVPKAEQLPDDLKELALRNGLDVRHASFHNDVDKLIRSLKGQPGRAPQASPGAIAIAVGAPGHSETRNLLPGNGKTEWFKDIDIGPEMVVVPAGSFMMGSPETEQLRYPDGRESPQHNVTIAYPFPVGRHAVTRGEFAAFVNDTGHKTDGVWRNPGFLQDDSHPVVCVNWDDANAYAAWLADRTGRGYRLLTEAEWEYVARAGTATPFWWGSSISPTQANYKGNNVYYRKATVPVDSFEPNPWGLYQVHGNVEEWCEDAWHNTYYGAPADGSAWLQGGGASRRVVRGGSWYYAPGYLRSASRDASATGGRSVNLGFRVGRTLTP
jgi:formylglycine-generating enzyme required for sulfatase activity